MGKRRTIAGVGERLTDDLLNEVLLRLPIKPLLRFKSVSKSWFSLISSHRFAKSHLQRALASAALNDQTLIVQAYRNEEPNFPEEDGSFLLLHLDSAKNGINLRFPYPQGAYPFVSEIPFQPPSKFVGSDCGIVCVSVDVTKWRAAKNKTDVYLWNPATKQSKRIPLPTRQANKTKVVLGFGFDHIDYDFKVLRVVRGPSISAGGPSISAEVYSSNMNVWRKIEATLIDVPYHNFHACLHGFLFAAGYNSLVAFDLNKEVFICDIDFPASFDNIDKFYHSDARITDFKDSIALFNSTNEGLEDRINLWTLDDDACLYGSGVKASWTLTISVYLGNASLDVGGLFNNIEFLIGLEDGSWVLYNFEKKVMRDVSGLPYFDEVIKYTESLFSVIGSKLVNWTSRLPDESASYYSDLYESDSDEASMLIGLFDDEEY